jgi:Holliday junction DNA helicase RuvA
MIAKLRGTIDYILEDSVIIDTGILGYKVNVSQKLLQKLKIGEEIGLYIHHVFKQEQQYLCGFTDYEEINVFEALLNVPSIGVKSALSVVSDLTIEEFAMAIANQDADTLCRVNGIGEKTAARILLELKGKTLLKIKDMYSKGKSHVNDAMLGLVSLGYQKAKVMRTLTKVCDEIGHDAPANEIIVHCLKELK